MTEGRKRGTPPSKEQVRAELLRLADLIRRLDDEDTLDEGLPLLMRRLGDLRQLLFEYEVRTTERLLPIEDPVERASRRIIREARKRDQEKGDDWGTGWTPPEAGDVG